MLQQRRQSYNTCQRPAVLFTSCQCPHPNRCRRSARDRAVGTGSTSVPRPILLRCLSQCRLPSAGQPAANACGSQAVQQAIWSQQPLSLAVRRWPDARTPFPPRRAATCRWQRLSLQAWSTCPTRSWPSTCSARRSRPRTPATASKGARHARLLHHSAAAHAFVCMAGPNTNTKQPRVLHGAAALRFPLCVHAR